MGTSVMAEYLIQDTSSFIRPIMRAPTKAPIQGMITFQIRAPIMTHFRPATCEEYGCLNYRFGWETIVPADSAQAFYIDHEKSRKWSKTVVGAGLVRYEFPPGQTCFESTQYGHKVPLERPAIFRMRDGDWRGNPTGRITTVPSQSWVDAFGENMEQV